MGKRKKIKKDITMEALIVFSDEVTMYECKLDLWPLHYIESTSLRYLFFGVLLFMVFLIVVGVLLCRCKSILSVCNTMNVVRVTFRL